MNSISLDVCMRFIPTGVGNTSYIFTNIYFITVHPHGCGEHIQIMYISNMIIGSSPRVWGTLLLPIMLLVRLRFIPTGVGNTSRKSEYSDKPAVHPHGCGEHGSKTGRLRYRTGSSPRVWGTLIVNIERLLILRFIPTGVGNTCISNIVYR